MKAKFDHSIGAALQACTSQAPVKAPHRLSGPTARGRDRDPGRAAPDAAEMHLTQRQLEVLALLCEGLQNKLICRRLNIAPGTVKVHISCILRELGVASRLAAVVEAQRRGLVSVKDVAVETRSQSLLGRLLASGSLPESTPPAMQGAAPRIAGGSASA